MSLRNLFRKHFYYRREEAVLEKLLEHLLFSRIVHNPSCLSSRCKKKRKTDVKIRDVSLVGLPLFSDRMQLRAIRNNNTYYVH